MRCHDLGAAVTSCARTCTGFVRSFVSETITLDLSEQTTLNITLQIGGVTEAVP